MPDSVLRCAPASEARGESLTGTASRVDRWLLVEQPGPWGQASVPSSRLGGVATAALAGEARRLGARLLLIRRPSVGAPPTAGGRQVYVVDSRPGHERTVGRVVADLGSIDPAGWDVVPGPLFLACTHGRHDACCAMRGRPLAAALAAVAPEATWECSHIGGDRFAGNVVVLPHGLYYGRVPPEAAADLVAATAAGRVLPEWLRGRTAYPMPVQAAQTHARAALGLDAIADLTPLDAVPGPDGLVVTLDAGDSGEVAVLVRQSLAEPAPLTCHAVNESAAPAWLTELRAPTP